MGQLVMCALSPHPPLLIPDVGGTSLGAVKRTKAAMEELAGRAKEAKPESIIVISPHGPVLQDAIGLVEDASPRGDFGGFGAPGVRLEFKSDPGLMEAILREAGAAGVPVARIGARDGLDHGTMVPMYYINSAGVDVPLLAIGMGFLTSEKLFAFGKAVHRAITDLNRKVILIASGDLSHRLIPGAPAGYDPQGKLFDEKIVDLLGKVDAEGIINMDETLVERAGECGYRPIIMMLGALDGYDVRGEVLAYEGPFGVGYAVATFMLGEKRLRSRESESPFVYLARTAIEEFVRNRKVIDPPGEIHPLMQRQAGVFCSIKKHGRLRGCIGTIAPTCENIAWEIIRNAIHSATEDPRFVPVQPEELEDLTYSVDVLSEPEPVSGIDELDPLRYGVIVRKGWRTGLLLPNLEGVTDAREQVAIARRKAGIGPDEEVDLERFEVVRYT